MILEIKKSVQNYLYRLFYIIKVFYSAESAAIVI